MAGSRRGRGSSWSRKLDGCDFLFYGWEGSVEEVAAMLAAREIKDAVLQAEPSASVTIVTDPEPSVGVLVQVRVAADEVAAFPGGPTHVRAIARALKAAADAEERGAWRSLLRRIC